MDGEARPAARYRSSRVQLVALVVAAAALALLFRDTFVYLYWTWQRDEYSHGVLVPAVAAYLLWQRRAELAAVPFTGSWTGVALVGLGLLVYTLGALASITTVDTYALVIVIIGAALAALGWPALRPALGPLALLFLMNPIPNFFYNGLSLQLQFLSSRLGVALMSLAGVSAYLDGNVIDLGPAKLEVAEACSGLRYLFPLLTLGVIIACLYRGRAWVRWCVVLSTVPITIVMNSVRIAVIGVLVDRYGRGQAEGFLHAFEGWAVFMVCVVLLCIECWLLPRLAGQPISWRALFAGRPRAAPLAGAAPAQPQPLAKPAIAALALLLAAVVPAQALSGHREVLPERAHFGEFPLQFATWSGRREGLAPEYLNTLRLDDYVLGTYAPMEPLASDPAPVNFYAAYYASQRTGQSAHSPRSCLPGGGWEIERFEQRELPGVRIGGAPLRVNRALIRHGASRQLVYYWFQERGRDLTNEYLVKWYLFVDALTRNRTDGALVRLVTPLAGGEAEGAADARLARFSADVAPLLGAYLPE